MFIKRKKGWEMPESQATPESAFHSRRRVLTTAVIGGAAVAGAGAGIWSMAGSDSSMTANASSMDPQLAAAEEADPSASLYPAQRSMRYRLDRAITEEKV